MFLGASQSAKAVHVQAAQHFGQLLVQQGLGLVYGGGRVGLMGVIADSVLQAGGEVIGVIPQNLWEREVAHRGLSQLHRVADMAERKALMAELSDAFVALPGGYGTLDELFEMLTWTQLGLQSKPCGLLNVAGFYDGLLQWAQHAEQEGLVRPNQNAVLLSDTDAAKLLQRLLVWRP